MSNIAADTTAAILVGGLGTRLRSVVADRPKVLAPVHGRPYLEYVLDQVADAGLDHVVLLAGYRTEQVREAMGESYRSIRLSYSVEETPLGTGGAARQALALIETPNLLLLNGDSYCEVDLIDFWNWHRRQETPCSLVLNHVECTDRFGRVELGEHGQVISFEEKRPGTGPGWINAGVYLLDRQLLASLPGNGPVSLERDGLPDWVRQGILRGFRSHGRFLDIGTPESYAPAAKFFAPV